MNAKAIDVDLSVSSADRAEVMKRRRNWPAVAILGFSGSAICFAVGLVIAALAGIGVIPTSRTTAYLSVATLLAAFGFAFLGAHALDRDRADSKDIS